MEMLQPTSPLGAVTIGYVVWRRSVFFVYLPLETPFPVLKNSERQEQPLGTGAPRRVGIAAPPTPPVHLAAWKRE